MHKEARLFRQQIAEIKQKLDLLLQNKIVTFVQLNFSSGSDKTSPENYYLFIQSLTIENNELDNAHLISNKKSELANIIDCLLKLPLNTEQSQQKPPKKLRLNFFGKAPASTAAERLAEFFAFLKEQAKNLPEPTGWLQSVVNQPGAGNCKIH